MQQHTLNPPITKSKVSMTTRLTGWPALALFAMMTMSLAACGDDATNKENNGGGGSINTGNAGTINAAPTTVEFASTEIGGEDVQTLLITNTGRGDLNISRVELIEDPTDGNREFFPGEDFKSSLVIKPNQSAEFTLYWRPLDSSPDTGKLVFTSNDPTRSRLEVPLNTPRLAPQIISPAVVQFPRVPAGMSQSQLTFIQNGGQAPLQLKDIFIDSGPTGLNGFTVSFPDPSNPQDTSLDKSTWMSPLAPNEQIPVRITFKAADDQPSTDKMIIQSNDPDESLYTVALRGNAGTPCILLAGVSEVERPAGDETHELNFGQSQIGRASRKTVQIQNCSRSEQLTVKSITMNMDGGGVFDLVADALPAGLSEGGVKIGPLETAPFVVAYTPTMEQVNTGRLTVESDDPVNSVLRVNVVGSGSLNQCPTARAEGTIVGTAGRAAQQISTIPLKTIQLSGLQSSDPDGSVQTYEWAIVKKPVDSTTRLSPSDAIAEPRLFLDLAGEYVLELTVYDQLGLASCETSKVTILANPDEDIHVQLVWSTNNTDLDLHYLHPRGRWEDPRWSIFWRYPTNDWGVPGNRDDDPSLDIDDTDGFGPENVNHDNPISGESYRIGVHYYSDNGQGPTYATIRIYLEGVLKVDLRDKYMEKENAFWDVGSVVWPSKQFIRVDRMFNGFP